ncbi:MAG: winged helix-turn-helix domain-containing protein [Acidobacteriota bacterium]|nr:winged helix-turn-helix domain-containing protein [Acidobacteriota bacterium]
MELREQVGNTAGKVWHQLSEKGPQTVAQLKKNLNGESDLLQFAIGWLAREDKVDIVPDKKNFRVLLK